MKNEDLLNINPKKDMKKPLIYGVIGFLVFIVAVIGFAIFQNMSSSKNNEILPPAPKEEKANTQEEFKPIPIEEAPQDNQIAQEANQLQNNQPEQDTQNAANQPQTSSVKPKESVKPAPKPVSKPKVVKKSKPANKVVANGKYYVQVAALLRNSQPNKKFLALLKKYGFNYTFKETYIVKNGEKIKVTKVLVGPYSNISQAKAALAKIKKEVTQNAFIYKVK